MTPVEELRAAAEKIRDIAQNATPGPWTVGGRGKVDEIDHYERPILAQIDSWEEDGTRSKQEVVVAAVSYQTNGFHYPHAEAEGEATHIATWHPGMAELVADLLDDVSRSWLDRADEADLFGQLTVAKLARAINGDAMPNSIRQADGIATVVETCSARWPGTPENPDLPHPTCVGLKGHDGLHAAPYLGGGIGHEYQWGSLPATARRWRDGEGTEYVDNPPGGDTVQMIDLETGQPGGALWVRALIADHYGGLTELPAEPPPLPKRVKGTHGPQPQVTP